MGLHSRLSRWSSIAGCFILRGRNLKSIVAGLRMPTQWVIEEHDPRKEPPAKNAVVVESMEFLYVMEKVEQLQNLHRSK